MSAMKQFTDEISDQFLQCKICLQNYKQPKTLSCLHTFCTSCLEKYLDAELERTQYRYVIYARCITCPVCRKRTEVPTGGIKQLPDNFLVSNLTEVVNRSKPAVRSPMCDFCSNAQRSSRVAISHCVECNKNMCRACADLHKRTKVTRNHSIFDVKAEKSVVCKVHENEPLRFFCQPCEICICVACTFHEHQGHEVASFGDGIQKYASDMESMTNLCLSKMASIQNQLNVINRCEDTMGKVEEHIKSIASNLIVQIRLKQRNLLDEIRQFYGSEALELCDNKEELEQIMDNLSSTCDLAQIVLKERNVELLLLHKEVREKMKTLIDFELPDLPDSMFRTLKFVQGAMFFGYLDSGQEVKNMEYDIKPSPFLPPEILGRLAVTSSVEETQTTNEDCLQDMGTTMNCDVVFGLQSCAAQTDELVLNTRRGSTQTENTITKSVGTEMDIPVSRNRGQNTDRKDHRFVNCGSQTNVDMIDALSLCHPVKPCRKTFMFDAGTDTSIETHSVACDTGITTATFGTTTEDLETELINKYLEMLDGEGEPHSPPFNIPFPVDIFDQVNQRVSPTSDTLPLISHILNSATVQKEERGTNPPNIKDITNGREIELTDVMLKDSSTNTDDLLPRFHDNPLYVYSDSYEGSSPEETDSSNDSSNRVSSDEERFTDQGTLIDKDDLIQILAGEQLVEWDESSALHDMIILDRMNTHRNLSYIDSAMNTDSVPMASRSIMTDQAGSRTVATITVANITVDAGTSARIRRPRREDAETVTDLVQYTDTGSDAPFIETADFGMDTKPVSTDSSTDWEETLPHSTSNDSDFISEPETPTDKVEGIAPRRRSSLDTGHLTDKLEGLFSMSKLQELTKKLERRPSQTAGLVHAVTRKLERQMSGEFNDAAREAMADLNLPKRKTTPPARRSSTSDINSKMGIAQFEQDHRIAQLERARELERAQQRCDAMIVTQVGDSSAPTCMVSDATIKSPKPSTSRLLLPTSPKSPNVQGKFNECRPKTLAKPILTHKKLLEASPKSLMDVSPLLDVQKITIGARKQLARVRRPDITALLSLNTVPLADFGFGVKPYVGPPKVEDKSITDVEQNPPGHQSQKDDETFFTSEKELSSTESSIGTESISDLSSTSSTSGTPVLTPFTDDSLSPAEGRSGTATPTCEGSAEWDISLPDDHPDFIQVHVRESTSSTNSQSSTNTEIFQTPPEKINEDTVVKHREPELEDGCGTAIEEFEIANPFLNYEAYEELMKIKSNVAALSIEHLSPEEENIDVFEESTSDQTDVINLGTAASASFHDKFTLSGPIAATAPETLLLNPAALSAKSSDQELPETPVAFAPPLDTFASLSGTTMQLSSPIKESSFSATFAPLQETPLVEYDESQGYFPPSQTPAPVYYPSDTKFNTVPGPYSVVDVSNRFQLPRHDSMVSRHVRSRSHDFDLKRYNFDENFLTLPTVDESSQISPPRTLTRRPKMGKMYTKKTSDTVIHHRVREEPARVVMGVSGKISMPRSKSMSTINSSRDSMIVVTNADTKSLNTNTDSKRSFAKTIQSFFKSSKSKEQKSKRNSSIM